MRPSPTSGYLSASIVALAISGLVAFTNGCATSNGETEDPATPPTTESPSKEKKADDKPAAPNFDASFDEKDGEGTKDPDATKDPEPPNSDQCIDNGDPGGSENVASKLPDTDDCDNDYKTITGVMKGAVDVDYYKLSASDNGVSLSHPVGCSLDTDFEGETAGTEVCVFMRCKNSTVDAVTGCDQGTEKTSDIGMKGCCAAAPGHALPSWDCSGLSDDDSADIFIKVSQINGDKCLPYKVRYKF